MGRRLARRTLFGSDYPFIPLDRWFSEFADLDLSDEARQSILFGNAARLLGIESSGSDL
jgi:predicted TIM-barrel fold metal-dependent hydrolase